MRAKRTLQIGRVCLMNFGPLAGKLFTVVNILDQNRVLGVGPEVPRDVYNVKQFNLTDLACEHPLDCRDKIALAAWKKANIDEAWNKTEWARKIARRKLRASLNDFDRFKVMLLRKERSYLLRHVNKPAKKTKA
eukprot:JZ548893.1.p2 GENE.JZ548893.1~~JZ548893.1.p2  ORF type:complete len:134 (+),score=50.49 JZ548893.1:24-425(+)